MRAGEEGPLPARPPASVYSEFHNGCGPVEETTASGGWPFCHHHSTQSGSGNCPLPFPFQDLGG